MPKFFTDIIRENKAVVTGEDAQHLSLSLRSKIGDPLTVGDGCGQDYHCIIENIQKEQVTLHILNQERSPSEPQAEITLFQALCKGDKMDWIIQKSVELGVYEIVPIKTERCIAKIEASQKEKKLHRFNKVAREAAKQCGRGRIPKVLPPMELAEVGHNFGGFDKVILFYEKAESSLATLSLNPVDRIAIIVGAEGGFSASEVDVLRQSGAFVMSLGKRILRCETAPLAALSVIMYKLGDI